MMPAVRCACIDVGSNTTALLVADVADDGLHVVETRRVFTLLGNAVDEHGISAVKIEETAAAVAELVAHAEELACEERITVVGTHTLRTAANAQKLIDHAHELSGREIEVIDGHAEARYAFIGAVGGLDRVRVPTVVIDIGGGSTEIAVSSPGEQPVTTSVPLGSSDLRRNYLIMDPPTADELAAARDHVAARLAEVELPSGQSLALAVGGGATTARELTGGVLDAESINRVLALTASMPSKDLAARFGLETFRARLVPTGLTIFAVLIDRLGHGLEVGRGGLREGLLIDRWRS